jgi:hypothetical protein
MAELTGRVLALPDGSRLWLVKRGSQSILRFTPKGEPVRERVLSESVARVLIKAASTTARD